MSEICCYCCKIVLPKEANDFLSSLVNDTTPFLPQSRTSHIQLCDAGIIASMKRLHKNCLLMHLLDSIGRECCDIYIVDI